MRPTNFSFLADLIARNTGIHLTPDKLYLLQTRLGGLCESLGLAGLDALVERLQRQRDPGLVAEITERITTNETSFFRDGEPFSVIQHSLIPQILKGRRAERRLSIWSAACSSGQEAYSISMLLSESFPELESWDVNIMATDISSEMVARCNAGVYAKHEVARGLSPERLRSHFVKRDNGSYEVAPGIARRVQVQTQNLLESFPGSFQFDLIMLRNVLIYFEQDTREAILRRVKDALRPGGFLMLGTAEAPRGGEFERADVGGANVFRRASKGAA